MNERWRRSGKHVDVFELPYRVGDGFWKSSWIAKARRLFSYLRTNWQTFRLIRKRKIQVLHCNDPAPFWHFVPAAYLCRVPVVLNLRDTRSTTGKAIVWKYRLKLLLVNRLLVLSNEMADAYRDLVGEGFLRFTGIRIDVIYSIVDGQVMHPVCDEDRQDLRSELGIASGEIAIGYVATFSEKKNQLDFIDQAAGPLLEHLPNAKVHFVGDFVPEQNEYARACRELSEAKGLRDRLSFVGYSSEISKWYQALDLVVVPTRQEGLARCMIEAIACATPVVSFDVCSAHEILSRHECGIVVSQSDYPSLVTSILELLNDPERRDSFGSNGRRLAESIFSHGAIYGRYASLYRGLVENKKT
ncbi:glycosyltransferase family 4 protein [Stieleria maiorica]|uniref:glycosyltransferase family 4 protein n=1 Tax=Stieleria maiorica TaxID=2795974 RepID=UPI00142F36AE|nr:glycosyltransferase family 4 protein [Stieleria maiorica]